ncbi:beta-ketoacyl-[acyl-carrier-protein] synthase family protein [Desulfogranum japonicum]|uniref:beta-ketoacyl-[acyl-carrier-protein] synthase family protein n=1 Tax=Desulfogranum japonicum TaxID=231447 RepID=UPI000400F31F|nr:beta-ketoacyl-[acyl-carrier-protein] synthase family protein [Desulfogranum japonicum]
MKNTRVFIYGTGIVSALGTGVVSTVQSLRQNQSAIRPLDLFTLGQGEPLPVGQADFPEDPASVLPRTHRLAFQAATETMQDATCVPDAVVIGTTTGGMLQTEQLLRSHCADAACYGYHGLGTVAEYLATEFHCTGPAVTVSTACSSGAVAITLALNMLRSGQAETVLVGGADSLCRLTYCGFHSLQLVDRKGCKPLDENRNGMAVGEGAGMLLLSTRYLDTAKAELLGAGLSCDAYHPAAPHPDGEGAYAAMEKALRDAGLPAEQIDYINLHGTGTPDNDLAESKAVRRLFSPPPYLSSVKGATGHSLAAAGAIEAVLAVIAITHNLLPANTGLEHVDPAIGLQPVKEPAEQALRTVLSNSFGFGGNNGSLVIGEIGVCENTSPPVMQANKTLAIHGFACITGAGLTDATVEQVSLGNHVAGCADISLVAEGLPPRMIRRLKRMPQMTLSLARHAMERCDGVAPQPESVFMGTGWGALSETHDFLERLAKSDDQFSSPTDFVGSVHNAPAGQVAIMLKATGANITTSGGDYSFEQAVFAAGNILSQEKAAVLMGVDEGHEVFSPLLDASISPGTPLADGGAAFAISREKEGARCLLSIPYFRTCVADNWVQELVHSLQSVTSGDLAAYGLIMAGIPAAYTTQGEEQLRKFFQYTGLDTPVLHYRDLLGEFASASAVATALAASFLETGRVPVSLTKGKEVQLDAVHNRILVLGLGRQVTAMELARP